MNMNNDREENNEPMPSLIAKVFLTKHTKAGTVSTPATQEYAAELEIIITLAEVYHFAGEGSTDISCNSRILK